jgi:hypothetical protein
MPPQSLSFPGLQQIRSWSFTLSHGIALAWRTSKSPAVRRPAEIGTMLLSFGDVRRPFPVACSTAPRPATLREWS